MTQELEVKARARRRTEAKDTKPISPLTLRKNTLKIQYQVVRGQMAEQEIYEHKEDK